MNDFIFVKEWLTENHAASLLFGILSAALWIRSATAKVKTGRKTVVAITFENEKDNVDLHAFFLTAKLQSKYNSYAALAAAATVLLQVFGF